MFAAAQAFAAAVTLARLSSGRQRRAPLSAPPDPPPDPPSGAPPGQPPAPPPGLPPGQPPDLPSAPPPGLPPGPPPDGPTVSVVVPARNEAGRIGPSSTACSPTRHSSRCS